MEADIVDKLKTGEIVIDPNVTVNVFAVHSKKVYDLGGGDLAHRRYGLRGRHPRFRSDHVGWAASKISPTARISALFRIGADGKPTVLKYNDKDVSHGKKLEQNILLKPGDHIYVD